MAIDRGKDWKWYLNTGTTASPTWTLIKNQKEGNVDVTSNAINTTTKDNLGWETEEPSTRKFSTDMTCLYEGTDATHVAIKNAAFNQTALEFRVVGANAETYTFTSYVTLKLSSPVDNVVEMALTFLIKTAPVVA